MPLVHVIGDQKRFHRTQSLCDSCKALLFNLMSHYNAPFPSTPAALAYSANCFLCYIETVSYVALILAGILSRAQAEEDEKCWQLQPLAIGQHCGCWELQVSP